MTSRTMVLIALFLTASLILALRSVATAAEPVQATQSQRQIKINEFMASNDTVVEDPQAPGKFPDWLELYNPTSAPVSLDGLYLINGDLADPVRFAITDGLSIPANGFVLFFADNDPDQGAYHTNFRLNKDGDRIRLYPDEAGTDEIDARLFGQQTTDYSEGREPDGGPTWRQYSRPTPGRTNILQPPLIADVTHSPQLPTSSDTVQVTATISDDGDFVTATLIYSTTDTPATSTPMTTSNGTTFVGQIPALPSGAIVHYHVRALDDEGEISPNPDLARLYYYRYPVDYTLPTLVINEVVADNGGTLEAHDDPASFPDWIELYNYGTQSVRLGGLFLTDKMDNPTKFAITDTLTIGPGKFLLFYADEKAERGTRHLNFKLDKNGESVAIYGAEGSVEVDRIKYKNLAVDVAYGRHPDGAAGEQGFLFCASPSRANTPCDKQIFMPSIVLSP